MVSYHHRIGSNGFNLDEVRLKTKVRRKRFPRRVRREWNTSKHSVHVASVKPIRSLKNKKCGYIFEQRS